jgi:hypothetical protein
MDLTIKLAASSNFQPNMAAPIPGNAKNVALI